MILQNLARFYDILLEDKDVEIAPPGFSVVNINFLLNLSPEGELLDLLYVFQPRQVKNKVIEDPRRIILPEAVKRSSGVAPNLLWDNATYVLGIADDSKSQAYIADRFEQFRLHNLMFLEKIPGPEASALRKFLTKYSLEELSLHQEVVPKIEALLKSTGFLTFQYAETNSLIADTKAIQDAIHHAWVNPSEDTKIAQCLVTGLEEPVQRIHAAIKGVRDVNSSGGSIVSFNNSAYESYGKVKGQGLNAPVGETAAFAYTTALNYLLSKENPHPKLQIGDATVVYWAESTNPLYADIFQMMMDPQGFTEPEPDSKTDTKSSYDYKMTELLGKIGESIQSGKVLDFETIESGLDTNTRFHVLGLSPNAARISIRFYEMAPFRNILARLFQHYEDLNMGQNYPWSVWRLLKETVSPKASDQTPAPLLGGAVMRSILTGLPYPAALYYAVINRIRADSDEPEKRFYKINPIRVGIIKACLTRKYRAQKNDQYMEVLTMALNPNSTNQAYLLGRLFAVLEKAQEDALGSNLNATIKDRYFTSACASPASTFPIILRLSQHHISKSEYGRNTEWRIREIMDLLEIDNDPFPKRLSLDEQGIFILGYYHQRTSLFTKREAQDQDETEDQDAATDTPSQLQLN